MTGIDFLGSKLNPHRVDVNTLNWSETLVTVHMVLLSYLCPIWLLIIKTFVQPSHFRDFGNADHITHQKSKVEHRKQLSRNYNGLKQENNWYQNDWYQNLCVRCAQEASLLLTWRWFFLPGDPTMSHWLQDFLAILWLTRPLKPPPTSSYGFSVTFSGRLLELWLRVIMGTTLGFDGAVWVGQAAGDPGTMRWPDGEVLELGVKVNPERGRVGMRPPPVLVVLPSSCKAPRELRFSMER